MNKKLRITFLSLFFWGVLFTAWTFSYSIPSLPINLSINPPSSSLDFSDLDIRDHLNRKIQSTTAQEQMENLFSSGLTSLILNNHTPGKKVVMSVLNQSVGMIGGWLLPKIDIILQSVAAWNGSKKHWGHSMGVQFQHIRLTKAPPLNWFQNSRNSFQFLVENIISSTHLLR